MKNKPAMIKKARYQAAGRKRGWIISIASLLLVFWAAASSAALAAEDHSQHNMNSPQEAAAPADAPMPSAEKEIAIGSMKVSLMPEYDSTSVLVINEGKFLNREAFPREVLFLIPLGVTKLQDVCSLSPGGQHFCQLFDITPGGGKNLLKVKLPYSDFFIDFQYAPFKAKPNSERDFTYTVEADYDIKNLAVVIQHPYRAERFTIEPADGKEFEKEGYQYYRHEFKDVKKGERKTFRISYFKADDKPSVDSKYTAMSDTRIFRGYTAPIILGAGIAGVAALLYLRRRKSAKQDGQA
ncbi:MAG: hypothetical protein HZA03_04760 [Nitrospinae bacterium]|nr:hypothetical protein [Nitrospinota bacterium]